MFEKKFIFSLLLIIVSPALIFIEGNFHRISMLGAGQYLYLSLFITGIFFLLGGLCFLIAKFTKIIAFRGLIVFAILSILFFNYKPLLDLLEQVKTPTIICSHYKQLWLIVTILIAIITLKASKSKVFRQIVFLFFALLAAFNILSITHQKFSGIPVSIYKKSTQFYTFKKKPNIYYLMTDMYANNDALKLLGYDNQDFLNILKESTFYIGNNSLSNYNSTHHTMSSVFKMDYNNMNENRITFYQDIRDVYLSKHPVMQILQDNGYYFMHAPAGNSEVSCTGFEDSCLLTNVKKVDTIRTFLANTPIYPLLDKFSFLYNSTWTFEQLINWIDSTNAQDRPKFIFAHIMGVHDLQYDQSCKLNHQNDHKLDLIHNTKCLNLDLRAFIQEIKNKDPSALIIIQADHGYLRNNLEPITKEKILQGWGILTAISFPDPASTNYIEPINTLAPVNLFRLIFAYLAEQQPNLLDNKVILYKNINGKKGVWLTEEVTMLSKPWDPNAKA